MKIYYGIDGNLIDVTNICINQLQKNNIIVIPGEDRNRTPFFTDPAYGFHKKIFIKIDDKTFQYDECDRIKINTLTDEIDVFDENVINKRMYELHSKLKLNHGSFYDELPEQKMVVRYFTGAEKVLEIGGNIGRNSLIIASILQSCDNLVTLESDATTSNQLIENRDLNGFRFHVENSALSNRKVIQRNWDTVPSDVLKEGYNWVKTITLNELKVKYNIEFDTLVLDCEGAFYYILMDMPEILDNINLIVMENDYRNISHKNYIDGILLKNNFDVDYVECGGWGPCYNNFYEVWKKNSVCTVHY